MDYKLEDIFNLKKVNQILERIASTFDVAVVMVDYEGVPVVSSHNFRLFCLAARSNPEERKRCVKCDVFAGLEAVRLNRPLLYCCHNNIVNASVPIVVGDNYLGAILLGQVIIEDSSEKIRVPSLLSGSDSSETWRNNRLNEYIDDLYEQVPKIEYSKLEKLALLIDSFTQYTIEQAVAMQRNRQNYEHVLRCASPSVGAVQDSAAYGDTVKSHSPRIPLKPDNVLFPALMYIEENPEKVVGMHEMAELCHLSHSYFSKIFQREMGENFTDYVGKRKVELAKKMLRESSDSVTSIASKLGFMDTSYFIKVFKKYEGTTPLVYRRQKYR